MQLSGKHAFITGGGTGIGLAIAQALAAQGAQVTITGRRIEVLEDAAAKFGGLALALDVTDPDATGAVVDAAVAKNGPVQICVPNAGIAEGLPSMLSTDWGRVIAVSSIAGVRGLRGAPAYSASKHGLIGLIRGLSEDYMGGPYTFNALCPGYVDTPIVTRGTADIAARAGISEAEALGSMVRSNRHKRLIEASEIGEAAAWLCSAGSGSVNGQTIQIAGGQV